MCERHKHWMDWSGKVVFGLLLQGRVDEMHAIVTASVSGCNLQETNFFSSLWFLTITITITIFSAFMVFLLSLCLKFSRSSALPHQQGAKKKSAFMFPLWWGGFAFMEGFPESAIAVLNFSRDSSFPHSSSPCTHADAGQGMVP